MTTFTGHSWPTPTPSLQTIHHNRQQLLDAHLAAGIELRTAMAEQQWDHRWRAARDAWLETLKQVEALALAGLPSAEMR